MALSRKDVLMKSTKSVLCDNIISLEQTIDALNGEISSLEEVNNTLEADVNTLKSRIETDKVDFESKLAAAKQEGSNKLKKEINHKEEMIISLKKELETVKQKNTVYVQQLDCYDDLKKKYNSKVNYCNTLTERSKQDKIIIDNLNNQLANIDRMTIAKKVVWFGLGLITFALIYCITLL